MDAALASVARPLASGENLRVEAGPDMMGQKRGLKRNGSKTSAEEASFTPVRKKSSVAKASDDADRLLSVVAEPVPPRVTTQSPELLDLEAIVINLERRTDRMDGCAARLQAYCPWLNFKKFPACDGRKTVMSESEVSTYWNTAKNVVYQRLRAVRKGWDDLDSYQVRDLDMSPGERGCAVSHIRAWEHCLARCGGTDRPLLVLEDDAAPTPEFTVTLERAIAATPSDAHLLYLGYSQAAKWRREVSIDVVEAEYVWTTVGYLVWPAGARLLLDRLPINQPVDNWMATMCAEGDIKAYCVRPKIIRQAEAWNVNSDVAHSDEHYWGPDSDIRHSDDFYWGKVPETALSPADAKAAAAAANLALGPMDEAVGQQDRLFMSAGSCLWDIGFEDSEESAEE
mmetsp:Transcript_3899/g.9948  ORF Transcript_3899/g.9948 Transcript_3899/m.9948 type:complete len:398 (-) Transcript_3899:116-1309(-)